ncbi:1637_t:CDS:2 [Ambispora leptoticha]|uniref:1637_t:CDS:1 n=1 Tax=Ambispora leptoticha TaxID=144679 RepID=A0A9N9C1S8_9GLOM|nr:1637_t:CDS:2 [Ambispora leptoticha]
MYEESEHSWSEVSDNKSDWEEQEINTTKRNQDTVIDVEERLTELEAKENEEDIDNLECLNEIAYREWEQEQDIDSNSMENSDDEIQVNIEEVEGSSRSEIP